MISLDDADRLTTPDLPGRLGVTLAVMPKTVDGPGSAADLGTKTIGVSDRPEPGRIASPKIDAPCAMTGQPPMQDTGKRSETTGAPDHLTELAASVLQHLREVQAYNRELTVQLADLMDAHRRDAMELVAAETREMATKEELERALSIIAELNCELARSRSSWWKKRQL